MKMNCLLSWCMIRCVKTGVASVNCAIASQTALPVDTTRLVTCTEVVSTAYRLLSCRVGAALVRSSRLALSLAGGVAISRCRVTRLLMWAQSACCSAMVWLQTVQAEDGRRLVHCCQSVQLAPDDGRRVGSQLPKTRVVQQPSLEWHCSLWTTSRRYAIRSSARDEEARSTMAA